jgi:hypothetical protein
LMRKRLQRPRTSGFSKHPQQMLTAGDGGRCSVWIEHESLPESYYDGHNALRADSKRGYRWPCPRPHMSDNYLNIKHKK